MARQFSLQAVMKGVTLAALVVGIFLDAMPFYFGLIFLSATLGVASLFPFAKKTRRSCWLLSVLFCLAAIAVAFVGIAQGR